MIQKQKTGNRINNIPGKNNQLDFNNWDIQRRKGFITLFAIQNNFKG